MNLKKIGNVLTSKSVGTGPSFYEKIIYGAAVSQRLKNTDLDDWRAIPESVLEKIEQLMGFLSWPQYRTLLIHFTKHQMLSVLTYLNIRRFPGWSSCH